MFFKGFYDDYLLCKKKNCMFYKGFYEDYFSYKECYELDEETFEDELEEIKYFGFLNNIDESFSQEELCPINLEKYLDGYCDEFALMLNKRFGYPIHAIVIDNQKGFNLIHAYCTFDIEREVYYVDARGITNDKELFFYMYHLTPKMDVKYFDDGDLFVSYLKKKFNKIEYTLHQEKETNLLMKDDWLKNYYAI